MTTFTRRRRYMKTTKDIKALKKSLLDSIKDIPCTGVFESYLAAIIKHHLPWRITTTVTKEVEL